MFESKNPFGALRASTGCTEISQQGRLEVSVHSVEGTLDHLHALECRKWLVV